MALPLLLAAATGLSAASSLAKGSAERKAANNRATALRDAAQRRLSRSKQQADLERVKAGANRTSTLANMLGRGVSRNDSTVSQSLDEITNRAEYEINQSLSDAQFQYNADLQDADAISKQGKDAQKASLLEAGGTILGGYTGYLKGKYASDAFTNGKWW